MFLSIVLVWIHDTENICVNLPVTVRITFDTDYTLTKSFPEIQNKKSKLKKDTSFELDTDLDFIGELLNLPRRKYTPTKEYEKTIPPFNDRLNEDDYHYLKRLKEYTNNIYIKEENNTLINKKPLPLLIYWKYTGNLE